MNSDFRLGTLDQLIDFRNGKAIKKTDGSIPIYGGNGIIGYADQANYEKTLVIGRVGANCGSVHIEREKCWVSDNAIAGLPKNEYSNEYNFYLLKSLRLNEQKVGSSQPLLTQGILNNIQVTIQFNPTQQKKIAAVLAVLDAKIDCNNRINAELEAMAKTLYDYWFVQFDFPDANGAPYKSSGGKMVYNTKLKREIPEGWQLSTIGGTFKTYLGGTPSRDKDEYWEPGEVNWLSSGENPSTFVVAPDEKISNLGLQNSPAKLLPAGTVILSIVRHLRASILSIEAATNQSVVGIVETKKLKHCFIYPYLVREIPRLMALRTGAQQPHINKGVLDESLLVIPDDATLNAYTSKAAYLFSQIQNNLRQNMELTQLRDWLLPLLMNGQVTVA